ncbi:hypothetical protein [Gynuella sp.]|uniref:hypothetical protein n=1 Tax=Gynuella sp. TaxID=2969146 RepID=UPI003D1184B7
MLRLIGELHQSTTINDTPWIRCFGNWQLIKPSTFKDLIPMLRKVKENFQIVMATHNTSLPVNGELVYILEAREDTEEALHQRCESTIFQIKNISNHHKNKAAMTSINAAKNRPFYKV